MFGQKRGLVILSLVLVILSFSVSAGILDSVVNFFGGSSEGSLEIKTTCSVANRVMSFSGDLNMLSDSHVGLPSLNGGSYLCWTGEAQTQTCDNSNNNAILKVYSRDSFTHAAPNSVTLKGGANICYGNFDCKFAQNGKCDAGYNSIGELGGDGINSHFFKPDSGRNPVCCKVGGFEHPECASGYHWDAQDNRCMKDSYPNCYQTADCRTSLNEKCINGKCSTQTEPPQTSCKTLADCPASEECKSGFCENKKCLSGSKTGDFCGQTILVNNKGNYNLYCGNDLICGGEGSDCSIDVTQCASGYTCDATTKKCGKEGGIGTKCKLDSDCNSGFSCKNGKCEIISGVDMFNSLDLACLNFILLQDETDWIFDDEDKDGFVNFCDFDYNNDGVCNFNINDVDKASYAEAVKNEPNAKAQDTTCKILSCTKDADCVLSGSIVNFFGETTKLKCMKNACMLPCTNFENPDEYCTSHLGTDFFCGDLGYCEQKLPEGKECLIPISDPTANDNTGCTYEIPEGVTIPKGCGTDFICGGEGVACSKDGGSNLAEFIAKYKIVPNMCADGYSCVNGACAKSASCRSDAECGEGEVCISNVCVPDGAGPICIDDKDCINSDGEKGICLNPIEDNAECFWPTLCGTSSDCGNGEICLNGECKPFGCTTNGNCGEGRECVNNQCVIKGSKQLCDELGFGYDSTTQTCTWIACSDNNDCPSKNCDTINDVCLPFAGILCSDLNDDAFGIEAVGCSIDQNCIGEDVTPLSNVADADVCCIGVDPSCQDNSISIDPSLQSGNYQYGPCVETKKGSGIGIRTKTFKPIDREPYLESIPCETIGAGKGSRPNSFFGVFSLLAAIGMLAGYYFFRRKI